VVLSGVLLFRPQAPKENIIIFFHILLLNLGMKLLLVGGGFCIKKDFFFLSSFLFFLENFHFGEWILE
jgi:hypothetical protein